MQILLIEAVVVLFLIVMTIAIICDADLFACAIIFCAFSFSAVLTYLYFGSPDVAFTEAVIGAMSTVFYAVALKKVDRFAKTRVRKQYDDKGNLLKEKNAKNLHLPNKVVTLLIIGLLAGVFCGGTAYLPEIGDPNSAPNAHISNYYIEHSKEDTAAENIVSGTLADYRGYDTMFETSVMFVSGLVVTLILMAGANKRSHKKHQHNSRKKDGAPVNVVEAVEKGGAV